MAECREPGCIAKLVDCECEPCTEHDYLCSDCPEKVVGMRRVIKTDPKGPRPKRRRRRTE